MMEARVDFVPRPSFSISWTSLPWEYRAGGSVCFLVQVAPLKAMVAPSESAGSCSSFFSP